MLSETILLIIGMTGLALLSVGLGCVVFWLTVCNQRLHRENCGLHIALNESEKAFQELVAQRQHGTAPRKNAGRTMFDD